MQNKEIINISGTNPSRCMACGKCLAVCPSEMDVSPHKLAKYIVQNNLEPLLQSKTLDNCLSCLSCVEKCPRGVEPANLVEAFRKTQMRKQDHHTQLEIPDDIPQQLLVAANRKY